jgi:hypothetical protein
MFGSCSLHNIYCQENVSPVSSAEFVLVSWIVTDYRLCSQRIGVSFV